MKINTHLFVFLCILFGCKNANEKIIEKDEPSHWVGDIHFDSTIDNPDFILCDSTHVIHRRNGLTYPGGRQAVVNECLNKFQSKPEFQSFSGYIMVRFVMNCHRELGRFRVQPLDYDFSLKKCPNALKEHVLSIVKNLDGWGQASDKDKNSDCSKYLNFKIQNGQLENILQ